MKLEPYEDQHDWDGVEFPVSIKRIDMFEKKDPDIAVKVLFNNKKSKRKSIYIVRRSGRNRKC